MKTKFTEEEQRYIEEHYSFVPSKIIARELGRSAAGVRCWAKRNGLAHPAQGVHRRKGVPSKCGECQLWSGECCIYHLEATSSCCQTMRYTAGAWPEKKNDMQILFENL